MHKYKKHIYIISLFFGLVFLFGRGIVFGQSDTNCRESNPVANNDLLHKGHVYTCEWDADAARLIDFCAKDGTTSNLEVGLWCPLNMKCHVCECKSENRENGKCQTDIVNTPECTENEECVGENKECIEGVCQDIVNGENNENNENNEDDEECPIKDSEGICCKKIYYDLQLKETTCCEGILLNTNVPFIGQCIVFRKKSEEQPTAGLVVDESSAFPILMGGLSKILVSIILLVSFMGILIGGIMISASGGKEDGSKKGKKIIGNIISALALLGASGIILKLINPNFFG